MGSGEIEPTHDYYLKRYQLSNPVLKYDTILFDEGQDASPVMLDVIPKQSSATRVIVGDEHQQIYGFRHATNAMQQVDFPSLSLNTSFRFNSSVAELAVQILNRKKLLFPSFEAPAILGMGFHSDIRQHAVLGRTNAGLLKRALELVEESSAIKLYFEGGFEGYSFNSLLLYDILYLHLGRREKIKTKMVQAFRDIDELENFAVEMVDLPLQGLISIATRYEQDLFLLMKTLKSRVVESAPKADFTLSTVHKAKGMEYDEVTLLSDFCSEKRVLWEASDTSCQSNSISADHVRRDFYKEESNLAYVAVTRTKCLVNLPKSVAPRNWQASGDAKNVRLLDE